MDRRRLLRLSGATLAAAVAGCQGDGTETDTPDSGDGGDGGDGGNDPTASPTPTSGSGADTATPTATPTPESEETPTETQGSEGKSTPTVTPTPSPTPTPTATPRQAAQVVAVADGELAFAPETFEVAVGDTVVWVWYGSGHNVVPSKHPQGSSFSGTPGGASKLYDEGYEFSYTFETAGEYEYYCNPHRSVGMVGSFTVTE